MIFVYDIFILIMLLCGVILLSVNKGEEALFTLLFAVILIMYTIRFKLDISNRDVKSEINTYQKKEGK